MLYKRILVISAFILAIFLAISVFFFPSVLANFSWKCCSAASLASSLYPTDPTVHYELGNYYFGGGSYNISKAKEHFKESIELSKKNGQTIERAHFQLSRIYFIEGNFFQALEEIDKEIELFPEYKRSYYIRGVVNGYDGDLDEAVKDFKIFLQWKPDSWAGHNDLVWIYFTKGDFKNAEKYSREGLEYFPDNPWLNNSLGVALLNLEQYEEAKKHLEKALVEFEKITPEGWGVAYPGNDPDIYREGYEATKKTILKNIALAESKMISE